jgi:hypothetical protein
MIFICVAAWPHLLGRLRIIGNHYTFWNDNNSEAYSIHHDAISARASPACEPADPRRKGIHPTYRAAFECFDAGAVALDAPAPALSRQPRSWGLKSPPREQKPGMEKSNKRGRGRKPDTAKMDLKPPSRAYAAANATGNTQVGFGRATELHAIGEQGLLAKALRGRRAHE